MMTEGDRSDTVPGDTLVRIPSYRMRRGGDARIPPIPGRSTAVRRPSFWR